MGTRQADLQQRHDPRVSDRTIQRIQRRRPGIFRALLRNEAEAQSQLAKFSGPDGLVRRISYYCAKGLAGQAIAIIYPGPNPSVSSLMRYSTASGERHIAVLGPQETNWNVPHAETPSGVARQYALLGIEHIWAGVDHLLFLVCLLCGSPARGGGS